MPLLCALSLSLENPDVERKWRNAYLRDESFCLLASRFLYVRVEREIGEQQSVSVCA
jgi:hypothetical protein